MAPAHPASRLSRAARRALAEASVAALKVAAEELETEHLLLGVLAVRCPEQDALAIIGITPPAMGRGGLRRYFRRNRARPVPSASVALVIEAAYAAADARGSSEVEPRDLVAGLLEADAGSAGGLLRGAGVSVSSWTQTLEDRP
ncbi:MAG: Clp protease N-terminal domain-containing protein [Candidatus Dormibacteria bacterium]